MLPTDVWEFQTPMIKPRLQHNKQKTANDVEKLKRVTCIGHAACNARARVEINKQAVKILLPATGLEVFTGELCFYLASGCVSAHLSQSSFIL